MKKILFILAIILFLLLLLFTPKIYGQVKESWMTTSEETIVAQMLGSKIDMASVQSVQNVTGFTLAQSTNSIVSVAMSDTAQVSGNFSYRFGLLVNNSTITNPTVVPYGRWVKPYTQQQTFDSLRALVMVPPYATGSIRMAYGFADASGNIVATTTLVTLAKGQGWKSISLPINVQGTNFSSLVVAFSYESGQQGTEVVFLGKLSLVNNALGAVTVLDDGNGVPSSGIPTVPVLSSPVNGSSSATSPSLVWNASANATTYNVQVATDANFTTLVVNQTGLTGLSYQSQLAAGTYYWRVSATNASGTSAYSGGWSFTITISLPGIPILLTPAYGTTAMTNPITFSWQISQNASEYEIQIAVSIFFTDIKYSAGIAGTHITFAYFSPNTTYHWRVRGKNTSGVSDWSPVSYFVTAPMTGVEEEGVPKEFSLSQNYPNPFNPTTMIKFQLPISNYVTLKIYDVLGKEVATLFDGEKPAGMYEVQFNASNIPSGVYFYTLRAGEFIETRKMILLK